MSPDQIVTSTLLIVLLVTGMDLGIAALIRASRESGKEPRD